jgi:hypothetical protein
VEPDDPLAPPVLPLPLLPPEDPYDDPELPDEPVFWPWPPLRLLRQLENSSLNFL